MTGYNGNNETNIQASKSLSLTLFTSTNEEISVKTRPTDRKFDFWIAKHSTSIPIDSYTYINVTNSTNTTLPYVTGFNLTATNASIHIQIKPEESFSFKNVYQILIKFGQNPSRENYDFKSEPTLFASKEADSSFFYLTFFNMSQVNSFKGYVGILIQENQANNFSTNFWLRIFAAGCYYLNEEKNEWSSLGMEILADTNLTHTHCVSSHLSTFAGGFIVLPNAISFDYVWSNASPIQNPTVYLTVIALICIYVLGCILAWRMDKSDEKKLNVVLLNTSNERNGYFYEIVIFTGSRPGAGTDSKV